MPRPIAARWNSPRNSGPRRPRRSIGSGAGTGFSTDSNPPFYRWFAGARLNTCWNALDRHVAAGRGERVALIWDSPVTGAIERFHLSRDARPDGACRRDARRARGAARRPRADLYADGAGGGDRDARLRPDRRGAFGRVRRVRGARTGDPHRRRAAARGAGRLVRHRGEPGHPVQAAARRGDRRGALEAGSLRRAAAADVPGRTRAGPRP